MRIIKLIIPVSVLLFAATVFPQQMATVTRTNATLHGTPVSTGKIMAKLDAGTRVEILIAQGTWHLVQSSEYVGWISNGAIKADVPAVEPSATPPLTLRSTTTQSGPTQTSTVPSAPRSGDTRGYTRGPRGGCYYISSSGKKTYVDRSLCN